MAFNADVYKKLQKSYPALPPNLKEEQLQVIKHVCEGRNVLALLPTGFGKTLMFTIPPLLESNKLAVVVSPLKALMADQVAAMRMKGVSAVAITADMSAEDRDHAKKVDVKILLASPEALEGWLSKMDTGLYRQKVCLVAVDEVHTLAEWGDTFRPSFKALGRLRSSFDSVPLLMLTATLTAGKRDSVFNILHVDKNEVSEVFASPDRPNINLSVRKIGSTSVVKEMNWYLDVLCQQKQSTPKCVIYVNGSLAALGRAYGDIREKLGTRVFSEEVPDRKRMMVEVFHGSLIETDRRRILQEFTTKESVVRCLLCTSAFGMGVDVADIKYVVVWGAPSSMSELWQQIGRAGRDGSPSETKMMFSQQSCQRSEPAVKLLMDSSKVKCLRNFILDRVVYKDIEFEVRPSGKCCCYCDRDGGSTPTHT